MAFTKALYYPYIDVDNENWLKSAAVYWDQIHTIVPESVDIPYSNPTSQELSQSGILVPLHVNSRTREVQRVGEDVFDYLESIEGKQVVFSKDILNGSTIYLDKFSERIRDVLMYLEKFPESVLSRLAPEDRGRTMAVDQGFGNYYMTILAKELSASHGFCPLSESESCINLLSVTKRGATIPTPGPFSFPGFFGRGSRNNKSFAQAIFFNLTIKSVNLHPDTTTKEILRFREKYINQIGKFRDAIGLLAAACDDTENPEAIQQHVNDAQRNHVIPALSDLEETLRDSRIKYQLVPMLSLWYINPISENILSSYADLPSPWAMVVTPTVQAILSYVLYDRSRKKALRNNPYSFLLKYKNFAALTHLRRKLKN